MKALVYHRSVPRYLASAALNRFNRKRFHRAVSPLRLSDAAFDPPSGWVTLRPLLCGICGSDINLLKGAESMLLEPYASMPAILGHEIVAEVVEAPEGSGFTPGTRVAVEPVLGCETRGLEPCRFCSLGDYNLCENFTLGELPPGSVLGYNARAGGGMAERTAAHPSRLFALPGTLSDEDAVLIDSLASALQPVLDHFPAPGQTVVVYGAGILGQHVIRCLRVLGAEARIVAIARHAFQAELAALGGADLVLRSPDRKTLAESLGARHLPTTLGGGNIEGGADVVYDCVGGGRSLQESLLALRARGVYVMIGTGAEIARADVSSLWFRQLTVTGTSTYAHGPDPRHGGRRVRTYGLAVELAASGAYALSGLLTHRFRLEDYAAAFGAAFDKGASQSMKVAFDLR